MDEREIHYLKRGTLLNMRYRIRSVIGEGGFGITYFGRDELLGMDVAVKEFYPQGIATRNNTHTNNVTAGYARLDEAFFKGKSKFIREARTVAKFNRNKGIVSVIDFFEENNTAYIVMEYLDGVTLKEYLKGNRTIPAEDLLSLLGPLLESLDEVHQAGMIHRDISPDNIMVLRNGDIKLMDFGAARDYTKFGEKSLSVVLKPGFAPPEQYQTHGVQGPWTDIYALSATIYKCLTGQTPQDSIERVMGDRLQPPSAFGVYVPRHMERAVLKGMSVEAGNRYQNLKDFCDNLYRDYDEGMPGNAGPELSGMGSRGRNAGAWQNVPGQNDGAWQDVSGQNPSGQSKKYGKVIIAAVFVICLVAAGGLGLWFGQGEKSGKDTEIKQETEVRQEAETQEDTEMQEETDTETEEDAEIQENMETEEDAEDSADLKELSNPIIRQDSDMSAGQSVAYHCVWFGSYPQTEVVSEEDMIQIETLDDMNTYYDTEYEIVSAEEFQEIEEAGKGCENGDFTVGDKKYRKVTEKDATFSSFSKNLPDADAYYIWTDDTTYHYFKYEPIKWRVLERNGEKALLLSDVALDTLQYNTSKKGMTWKKSTIRSWLNGYSGDSNSEGADYSSRGFLNTAFSPLEQEAIEVTLVENADNLNSGTKGGKDTKDRVFLLSESEVYGTDVARSYGFVGADVMDEARMATLSTYAYAMGGWRNYDIDEMRNYAFAGNCDWLLRSPGHNSYTAAGVNRYGFCIGDGYAVEDSTHGVRPALYLDLSSGSCSYAGIVCPEIVDEVSP